MSCSTSITPLFSYNPIPIHFSLFDHLMMAAISTPKQLKILYEAAFTAIEKGKKYETSKKLIQAKQHYVEGIQKFMHCIEMEPNPKKKKMLKESVADF